MRILFTFAGASGHLDPLLPVARAARAVGHEIAFAGRPLMLARVRALGFDAFPAGTDTGLTPKRVPLRRADAGREAEAAAAGFARRIPRERARDLLPLCERWRPDVVVWEGTDLAGPVVAERVGIVHASVLVIAAGGFLPRGSVAGPLDELRAELGLPPDPDGAMRHRYLVLVPFPPRFRDPAAAPLPPTAHAIRPAVLEVARDQSGDSAADDTAAGLAGRPAWFDSLSDRPLVYVTLGSVFPFESGDLFQRIVAGVRELPVTVVVTVGPDLDPAELGPQPANVHVERWIPQAALLPRCELVISHGGSGSVIGALAHGVPLVVLPLGADQPLNGRRVEALHAGRVLDALDATPAEIRDAAAAVLSDPASRAAAGRFREESLALPGADHAVALLERLVAERRPILD